MRRARIMIAALLLSAVGGGAAVFLASRAPPAPKRLLPLQEAESLLLDAARAGDARGNTALMDAAFKGHAEIVTLLASQPCAVDQPNASGQTALMYARLFGRDQAAALLEARGASSKAKDYSGRTATDWAATQLESATLNKPVQTKAN